MRAYRNTKLNFGLVSTDVSVYPAKCERDISFSRSDKDGTPVEQIYRRIDNGEIVGTTDDCEKSYQGTVVPKEAIEAIINDCKMDGSDDLKMFNIKKFIPLSSVPYERITGSYYIAPNPKTGNKENFVTIMRAMENKGLAAVCKWIPSSRQTMVVMWPQDGILVAVCVAMKSDVADYSELRVEADVSEQTLAMAEMLIDAYTDADASIIDTMEDAAVAKRLALVEQYVASGVLPKPVAKDKSDKKPATDLMAALEASIEAMKGAAA